MRDNRQVRRGALMMSLALVCAQPALAHAAPTLAGQTTIEAARTGYTEVELPRRINDPLSIRFSFQSAEEFTSVALRAVTPAADGRYPTYRAEREGPGPPDGPGGTGSGSNGPLPAGGYRLYYIGGDPGSATLRIPGLEGELRVSADLAAPFDAGPLPERSASPGTLVFGRNGRISPAGFGYVRIQAEDFDSRTSSEFCIYPGGDERAGGSAYQPGCPGTGSFGRAQQSFGFVHETNSATSLGLGGNVVYGDAPRPRVDAYAFWFSWVDDAVPQGDAPPEGVPDGQEPAASVARVSAARVRVRGERARLPVTCGGPGPCVGRARLAGARGARFRLGRKRTARVPVRVNPRQRRILRRRRTLRVTAIVRVGSGALTEIRRRRVLLVAPRARPVDRH